MQLTELFDRIRDGLTKQEAMRKGTIQAFEAWAKKARPTWDALIDEYTAELGRHYGLVLCGWLDWLDANKLAWRGEIRWQIPTKGPLTFTPPSTEGLMTEIGKIVGELGLEDALARSARWSAAPTQKTRGGRGQGTVRKSQPKK